MKVCLGGLFPFQGGNEVNNHTLAGIEACVAAGQVCLQGSL